MGLERSREQEEGLKKRAQYEQYELPGMDIRSVVRNMSPEERASYKQRLLDGINSREQLLWVINEVDEGNNND